MLSKFHHFQHLAELYHGYHAIHRYLVRQSGLSCQLRTQPKASGTEPGGLLAETLGLNHAWFACQGTPIGNWKSHSAPRISHKVPAYVECVLSLCAHACAHSCASVYEVCV